MNRLCLKCESPIPANRKYCGESCKYWYNLIKKEKEAGMPPLKKRSERYFSMVTGYRRAKTKGGIRPGKRVNGMVTGAMAGMVNETIETWAELNPENLDRHFSSISFYTPSGIELGNGRFVKREDIPSLLALYEGSKS